MLIFFHPLLRYSKGRYCFCQQITRERVILCNRLKVRQKELIHLFLIIMQHVLGNVFQLRADGFRFENFYHICL